MLTASFKENIKLSANKTLSLTYSFSPTLRHPGADCSRSRGCTCATRPKSFCTPRLQRKPRRECHVDCSFPFFYLFFLFHTTMCRSTPFLISLVMVLRCINIHRNMHDHTHVHTHAHIYTHIRADDKYVLLATLDGELVLFDLRGPGEVRNSLCVCVCPYHNILMRDGVA